MTKIKVCCISDTHGYLPQELPEADMLLHAGDLTHHNDMQDQAAFMNTKFYPWWKEQKARLKYFIAGNHDFVFEEFPALLNKDVFEDYLQDDYASALVDMRLPRVDFDAPTVWGTPRTPTYGRWAFMGSEMFLEHKFFVIPDNTDIILSHGPPHGILDKNLAGEHCGSKALMNRVNEIKPKLVVFGHIHEGRDDESVFVNEHGTTFVNASIMNGQFNPNNPPVVVEIEV
jgi:predicted phosphodiesterase